MFLDGLNNIDFSGIGSLGEGSPVEFNTAVDLAMSNIPFVYKLAVGRDDVVQQFQNFKAQGYGLVQSSSPISFANDNTIAAIAVPDDVLLSGQKRGALIDVLSSLRGQGYYVVSATAAPSATATSSSTPTTTGGGSVWNPTRPQYQAAQQALQAAAGSGGAPAQQGTGPASNIQRGPLPVRRITRGHVQTPAEKKRLYWIIGGFGAIFVLALGLIASRD